MSMPSHNLNNKMSHILHRYHVIIFALFVLGGLVGVVLVLNGVIAKSSNTTPASVSTSPMTSFDQATITRLNQLRTRDQAPIPLDLSKGRTNPFVE